MQRTQSQSVPVSVPTHTCPSPCLSQYQPIPVSVPVHTCLSTNPYLSQYQSIPVSVPTHTCLSTSPYLSQPMPVSVPVHTCPSPCLSQYHRSDVECMKSGANCERKVLIKCIIAWHHVFITNNASEKTVEKRWKMTRKSLTTTDTSQKPGILVWCQLIVSLFPYCSLKPLKIEVD